MSSLIKDMAPFALSTKILLTVIFLPLPLKCVTSFRSYPLCCSPQYVSLRTLLSFEAYVNLGIIHLFVFKLLKVKGFHNIEVKSGHPQFLGILPDLLQWCLSEVVQTFCLICMTA